MVEIEVTRFTSPLSPLRAAPDDDEAMIISHLRRIRISLRRFLLVWIMIATALTAHSQNRPVGRSFATRSEVLAQHGMACTSQPLATQAAIEILKQGGSAIDAAIAADAWPHNETR